MSDQLTPAALAAQCKEGTVTASLRVKERTSLFFNYIAEQHDVSSNSLMGAVLDNYVKENTDKSFETYLKTHKIINALEHEAKQLAKLDDEELFANGEWVQYLYDNLPDTTIAKWLQTMASSDGTFNHYADIELLFDTSADAGITVIPENIDHCIIHIYNPEDENSPESNYIDETYPSAWAAVEMPYRKWLLFANLMETLDKSYRLNMGEPLDLQLAHLEKLIKIVDNTPIDDPALFLRSLINYIRRILTERRLC